MAGTGGDCNEVLTGGHVQLAVVIVAPGYDLAAARIGVAGVGNAVRVTVLGEVTVIGQTVMVAVGADIAVPVRVPAADIACIQNTVAVAVRLCAGGEVALVRDSVAVAVVGGARGHGQGQAVAEFRRDRQVTCA